MFTFLKFICTFPLLTILLKIPFAEFRSHNQNITISMYFIPNPNYLGGISLQLWATPSISFLMLVRKILEKVSIFRFLIRSIPEYRKLTKEKDSLSPFGLIDPLD